MFAIGYVFAQEEKSEEEKKNYDKIYKYTLISNDKKVGHGKAVATDWEAGVKVRVTSRFEAKVLGVEVKVDSKTFIKYNHERRLTYYDIYSEGTLGTGRVVGKRKGKGWDIKRTEKGKTKSIRIEDKDYEQNTYEPSLWSGKVGSKKTMIMFMAGQAKVNKATITIIGREKAVVQGHETNVTHYKVKGPKGEVEEWRTDEGPLVKSIINSKLGEVKVRLVEKK
ncbi:MAG: DUF6134 family protein [Pseudomonadota bacterium]